MVVGEKIKNYDDDELVWAIAEGRRSYAQIGRDFGLSRQMVHYIARGDRRPELLPLIQDAEGALRGQTERMLAAMVRPAILRLAHLLAHEGEGSADVQRRAAADILKYALPVPGRQGGALDSWTRPPVEPHRPDEYYEWLAEKHERTGEDYRPCAGDGE